MSRESGPGQMNSEGMGMDGRLRELGDVERGESVLLAGEVGTETNARYCGSLLSQTEPDRLNVLLVTLIGDPTERIATVTDHFGASPATMAVVTVGESDNKWKTDGNSMEPETIETVTDPGDLPQLGLTISGALSDLDDDRVTVFCLHSITTLLQYVDLQRVYRFLHTLNGRMRIAEAVCHYHIDPAAHDDRTMATLRPLFDHVLETDR